MGQQVAVGYDLPQLPIDVKQCIARHVKVPQGDWSVSMVAAIIDKYQRREIELEDCLGVLQSFYADLQKGLRKRR